MKIKQCRIRVVIAAFICMITVLGTMALYMREYRRSAFIHLSAFCEQMVRENPEIETAVMDAMKQYRDDPGYFGQEKTGDGILQEPHQRAYMDRKAGRVFLETYGYRSGEFGESVPTGLVAASLAAVFISAGGFLFVIWYPYRYSQMRIAELTGYLEQINTGLGGGALLTKEDHFSRLQDEMYKTVTELYQTREQAVRAKAGYAENLANIAHQLKTPITAAFLSLQMMERDITAVGEKKTDKTAEGEKGKYVQRIKKQLARLQHLEEALLTLSRIDAGVLQLEHTEVDIYTVLNLASENLNDLLLQHAVSVSIPDRGCATFRGDMEWTMEALMNLIKNCMEHSHRGGTIFCDYSVNALYAEIRIRDEGAGFVPEELPHLFERFYRGRESDTGVGIGMPLAREIIELQNGTITAYNLPQGGACFEIRIYSH